MIMAAFIKTTREWWLVALCVILFSVQIWPSSIEYVYPIIDPVGSNMTNMNVLYPKDRKYYRCGEVVEAYFLFQKQRSIAGWIKWKLIPNRPQAEAFNYPARPVSSPAGITNHYAPVERIMSPCAAGEYHFEGTLTYPLFFGSVSYPLRTECFEVRDD